MATGSNYQTEELTGVTVPTTIPDINEAVYGITSTLKDCIIQNESINYTKQTADVMDQKNALVSQLTYDERWDITLDVLAKSGAISEYPKLAPNVKATSGVDAEIFEYGGHYWKLTGLTYTGSYNDFKKWNITGFRSTNYPTDKS